MKVKQYLLFNKRQKYLIVDLRNFKILLRQRFSGVDLLYSRLPGAHLADESLAMRILRVIVYE